MSVAEAPIGKLGGLGHHDSEMTVPAAGDKYLEEKSHLSEQTKVGAAGNGIKKDEPMNAIHEKDYSESSMQTKFGPGKARMSPLAAANKDNVGRILETEGVDPDKSKETGLGIYKGGQEMNPRHLRSEVGSSVEGRDTTTMINKGPGNIS